MSSTCAAAVHLACWAEQYCMWANANVYWLTSIGKTAPDGSLSTFPTSLWWLFLQAWPSLSERYSWLQWITLQRAPASTRHIEMTPRLSPMRTVALFKAGMHHVPFWILSCSMGTHSKALFSWQEASAEDSDMQREASKHTATSAGRHVDPADQPLGSRNGAALPSEAGACPAAPCCMCMLRASGGLATPALKRRVAGGGGSASQAALHKTVLWGTAHHTGGVFGGSKRCFRTSTSTSGSCADCPSMASLRRTACERRSGRCDEQGLMCRTW